MPHHPDENGPDFDDRLLVRPYVDRGGSPSRRTGTPLRPQPGPVAAPSDTWADQGPRPEAAAAPAPGATPFPTDVTAPVPVDPVPAGPAAVGPVPVDPARVPVPPAPGRRERGTRYSLVALGLLALLTAATLLALLDSPPDDPPRPVRPPEVPGPGLLARSPGAGEPDASSTGSARPSASAPPSSAPSGSASPAPSRSVRPEQSVAPQRTPTPAAGGVLRPGDTGAEVRALQERLFAQGFTYVSLTGVYDDPTRRGVGQFQSDRGLTGDPKGIYGAETRAAMGG
ncbi:peptidoglycan-binding protein [Streptomyces sp. NPDC059917]|uniref:peptidoglycan-binding domain-containing protein n=1 Tax=Streptomyces sp. NPDC059917 TaxID=3347002 RepID=UPI0036548D4C